MFVSQLQYVKRDINIVSDKLIFFQKKIDFKNVELNKAQGGIGNAGDFHVNTSDSSMKEFCSINRLKNLINEPTYYKNSEKPTYIDLILTNQTTLFQHGTVLVTGLSDFYLLTVTEFKMSFQKCKPHNITYQN